MKSQPNVLTLGLSIDEYWQLSYDEMSVMLESAQQKQEQEMKQRASMDFQLAYWITVGFNNPKGFPKNLQKAYPYLFEEESDTDILSHYEQMKRFAERHNLTYKDKEVCD